MNEKSADRIIAAVGKPAVRFDRFEKAALIRGLKLCAEWYREADELGTDAHRRNRSRKLGMTVSAIKRLDNLISDDEFWRWLSAPLGSTAENDRAVVKRLRRTAEGRLADIERPKTNKPTKSFLRAYSPFEWLAGAFLPLVYIEMNFPSPFSGHSDLSAIVSRNSSFIRFVKAALEELGITNTQSTIIRATTAVLNGRLRRKHTLTPGDHDFAQRVEQLRTTMFGEVVPDPFSNHARPVGQN
jgi:hypothetical protein